MRKQLDQLEPTDILLQEPVGVQQEGLRPIGTAQSWVVQQAALAGEAPTEPVWADQLSTELNKYADGSAAVAAALPTGVAATAGVVRLETGADSRQTDSAAESGENDPLQAAQPSEEDAQPAQASGDAPADPPDDTKPPVAGETPEPDDDSDIPRISDAEVKVMRRDQLRKAYFVNKLVTAGAVPQAEQAQALLDNIVKVSDNIRAIEAPDSSTRQNLAQYLTGTQPPDRFAIQDVGKVFVDTMLADCGELDMADLVMASRAGDNILARVIRDIEAAGGRIPDDRARELRGACRMHLVQAVSPYKAVGDGIVSIEELHTRIFGQPAEELSAADRLDISQMQNHIRDRLIISDMVMQAGLWTKPEEQGESSYARPPVRHELEELNARAASTIERLHLLKAYPVTPFEVKGELVKLPWDIAVVPPLDIFEDGSPAYAPGAVADFMFLPSQQSRTDMLLRFDRSPGEDTTSVSLGDGDVVMRFRLHDNGQISSGVQYHNIPTDITEAVFNESLSGPAFQRLRGLFIALAFDALVPDDVVRGSDVRGSVASGFVERPQELPGPQVADLLLRRQRALNRAGVSERQREPQGEGWTGPTREIGGYLRRLPSGTRARPTAEQEAHNYFASVNVQFDGLPEDHTFVSPYDRRATVNVAYRRARFRRSADTTRFMRGI